MASEMTPTPRTPRKAKEFLEPDFTLAPVVKFLAVMEEMSLEKVQEEIDNVGGHVRSLPIWRKLAEPNFLKGDGQAVIAFLIHMHSTAKPPCSDCAKRNGVFKECRYMTGVKNGSCTNHLWKRQTQSCDHALKAQKAEVKHLKALKESRDSLGAARNAGLGKTTRHGVPPQAEANEDGVGESEVQSESDDEVVVSRRVRKTPRKAA